MAEGVLSLICPLKEVNQLARMANANSKPTYYASVAVTGK